MYIKDKQHVDLRQTTYTFRTNDMYIQDKQHVHLEQTTRAFKNNI